MANQRFLLWLLLGMLSQGLIGCMSAYKKSLGGDTEQIFTKIYLSDFNTAWQSTLDALKDYPLDISSRESGFIRTRWVDNTSKKNFFDSFGGSNFYLKAQFRFSVSVAKGFYDGQPSVKISIEKEQLIQYDVLEGWKPVITDGIDEHTVLYRIGRIILVQKKLAAIENRRIQDELRESGEPSEYEDDDEYEYYDDESGEEYAEEYDEEEVVYEDDEEYDDDFDEEDYEEDFVEGEELEDVYDAGDEEGYEEAEYDGDEDFELDEPPGEEEFYEEEDEQV